MYFINGSLSQAFGDIPILDAAMFPTHEFQKTFFKYPIDFGSGGEETEGWPAPLKLPFYYFAEGDLTITSL